MKQIVAALIGLLFFSAVQAQKTVPQIKVGTILNYTAHYSGSDYPYVLTVSKLSDSVNMKWDVQGYGTGMYTMPAKSLESATAMYAEIPRPDATTRVSDKETILCISKAALQDLMKKKSTTYGGDTFNIVTTTHPDFVVSGSTYDVLYIVGAKSKTELWVLNNPAFPLICKSVNSPSGSDITLNSMK